MIGPRNDDGERKQVTVLFADVDGSMDLAERQDPEQWRKIMQRFFAILAEAVGEFEGTVDKFTGDGIMAVFGAPIAHEDHAQRACYAALRMLDDVGAYAAELRREQGLNFSTRIGINSGEVVAGAIGGGEDGAYTAIGHTVGLAQRMESLAEPGRAYLTEHTAALAGGFLALGDLGEFEIKGASRPVGVFRLEGVGPARSRLDLARARGFSRFVGRAGELAELEAALAAARRGEGGALGVVADPGVGKSRLFYEFAQRAREQGLEVFEAQAQAHGGSIPYMPVLQMLRAFFGLCEGEEGQAARERIAGKALLLDPEFADELPLLFDFLGVPDPERPGPQLSAEARQRALAGLVCRLSASASRRRTVVLIIEDLHWIDPGSEAMLAGLVAAIEGTDLLALLNYRHEYTPGWCEAPGFRQIELGPLTREHSRELLRDLAGVDASLDGLDEPVHERTQGNPFFVEEIVRELAERGDLEGTPGSYRLARPLEGIGVPATVQAILAARIDRLEPAEKALLQAASVVGREVGDRALGLTAGLAEAELEPTLRGLIGGGFLYEAELYPRRVLAFRHPLTREVAYGSQLAEGREATHAAAARATIELEPERHDELAALIAGHLEQGGETREAADWSARAAYWAGHSRPQDALRLWGKASELSDRIRGERAAADLDPELAALAIFSRLMQLDLAWRLGMERERAEALAAEARELAEACGDLRSQALLKLLTSARPGVTHRAAEWIAAADECVALADEAGDRDLRVAVRAAACYARMCAGDLDLVERTVAEILELGDGDPGVGAGIVIGCPAAWALMARSIVLKERDRYEEATETALESLRLAEASGDPETESWSRGNMATLLAESDRVEEAMALARRNCELTDRLGDVFSRSIALTGLGLVQLAAGEPEAALCSVDLSEREYVEAMGVGGEQEAWRGTVRAVALAEIGRGEEALAEAERAVGISRERGMLWQLPAALLALARIRRATGAPGVEAALEEATAICERHDHAMTLRRIGEERAAMSAA